MSRNSTVIFALAVVSGSFCAGASRAQPAVVYDQVDLSATAEREIENDELVAVVYAQAQAERQAEAANTVNEDIRWALDLAESARGVTSQTLRYNSYPVYGNNQRIIAWQARQSLRLESRDSDRLSELLGELQERVAIESVNYQVSREAREAADDELIEAALQSFNRRATLVAEALGRSGFRIVRININTGGVVAPIAFRTRAMVAEADVAQPTLEAGTQTVSVDVSGTIELNAPR
ncbi:MAG: SIMPL domain-containing protein [Gammaproteobacteria bacterium]|jgi:predicted secreted protein